VNANEQAKFRHHGLDGEKVTGVHVLFIQQSIPNIKDQKIKF
jgi:hypothetical protein